MRRKSARKFPNALISTCSVCINGDVVTSGNSFYSFFIHHPQGLSAVWKIASHRIGSGGKVKSEYINSVGSPMVISRKAVAVQGKIVAK